ncbi:MAG: hypothetical protein JXR70_08170 [Spirochaetales bacterium]|nr:hypothetical protein [Spirochaetales bacterium]
MKKILLLTLLCVFFASCIGIKNVVSINADLSGTIEWNYEMDNSIYQLGHLGDQTKDLPLPVLKEDFQRVCDSNKGLSLKSYDLKQKEDSISVKARVAFSHVSHLNQISPKSDLGEVWVVSEKSIGVRLNWGDSLELTADDKAMVKDFLEGYSLEMIFRLPGSVKSASLGEISSDKKQVSIKLSYLEALELEDDFFEISWQ